MGRLQRKAHHPSEEPSVSAMRDDTNVDWIHGLPFHSFDPSAYGRSVALVAFTYSTPWLALALVTVVAWAQFHRGGCMCGRIRAPRRPALLGMKPAMIMFLVMAYIACSLVPSAYTRYNEGSGDVDDALRALDALATGAMGHAAQAKSAAAECSAALAVVDTHFKDHMAPALKVQRARQAAEHFGAAAEGVGGMAWKDLGDMRGYDERWSRIDTWFTALSATTYTLLILAAIAPVAARAAGLSADGSTSRFNGVEKFTIAAPFLALVAAWLFLAASSPATVTLAETCHDWVPTVTERVPAGGRFYFFCEVDAIGVGGCYTDGCNGFSHRRRRRRRGCRVPRVDRGGARAGPIAVVRGARRHDGGVEARGDVRGHRRVGEDGGGDIARFLRPDWSESESREGGRVRRRRHRNLLEQRRDHAPGVRDLLPRAPGVAVGAGGLGRDGRRGVRGEQPAGAQVWN